MTLSVDQASRLAELDAILGAGTTRVSVADRTVEYDLEAVRRERDELRQLAVVSRTGSRFRRVKLVQSSG